MNQKRGEGLAIDYKGHLNSLSDLPKGDLPPQAVQYDEAGDLNELVEAVLPWHWPLLIFYLRLVLGQEPAHRRMDSFADHHWVYSDFSRPVFT